MRKPIFPRGRTAGISRKLSLLWLVFHSGLFLALGASLFFLGPVRINTGLLDMLPSSGALQSAARADAVLGQRNSAQIVILAASGDFSAAKAGAEELYAALCVSGDDFESLTLRADDAFLSRFRQYLYDYRFMLLDRETVELLDSGGAPVLAANALASAFGVFSLVPLDNLSGDPFLLTERSMQQFLGSPLLSSGRMAPIQDVLAAQYEGVWYVMLRATLTPKGLALAGENAIKRIYEQGAKITKANPGLEFYYSGVPFHSWESSSNAQKEISIISGVSFAAILALFFFIFRSPVPVLASFAAAGFSIVSGAASALLFFRQVHILSFMFGTALIGTCVDYSIHFFIHRSALAVYSGGQTDTMFRKLFSFKAGFQARARILRGISMSFVSTVICFAALLFAPFAVLKQFAVFLITGLSSSFLTVTCLFPMIRAGTGKPFAVPLFPFRKVPNKYLKQIRLITLFGFLSLFLVLLFINRTRIRVQNSLGDLYSMTEKLSASERIAGQVLNYGNSGWYFIVAGSDPEELLQNEEELRFALEGEIANGNLGSYMAASSFFPSRRTQLLSYRAAEKLLPLADAQFENLGFSLSAADEYRKEFALYAERFLIPAENTFPMELSSSLWIGKVGEQYYSCVLPLHAADEGVFRKIAGERENVFFINKVKDMGEELDRLTRIMLFLFLAAFVVIAAVVRRFYPWKQTFKICAVPVFIILAVLSVLSLLDIPLGFFSAAGLLLVFGLGLDYIFYSVEAGKKDEERPLTALAIFLSFATTVLSFGALALSSFAPVHIFGVTVLSGLCAAYIFSTLLSVKVVSENQRNSG